MDSEQKQELPEQPGASYKAVSRKKHIGGGRHLGAVLILLAACFTAGLGGGYMGYQINNTGIVIDRYSTPDGNAVVSTEERNISAVATKVGPSVVSIITQGTTESFFGSQRVQEGAGSGIILSKDGYILTNKHVVEGSDTLSVMTSDGTVYEDVRIVGIDPLNDLAFVKIGGVKNLAPATLGDSSSIRIGQNVVAIGNSLGQFQNTVTSGIISGTGRPISASDGGSFENLTDLIQTDAAINPGNSGGPLVNLSGQVIGINTAVAQNAQSIGFSIPINSAKGIIKNLQKTGKIERAYLGVNYIDITPEVAKKYELPVKKGAYVHASRGSGVVSNSPADKAGLKNEDIVTKVGDIDVGQQGNLSSLISEYGTGEVVPLVVIRDGKTLTVTVTLEAYPSSSSS
ncbi:trypsin-like peptidase domain-containing protein [Candidatus Saccharibacteria bacterium]|nr:trypsin-like peptidase domain-containing protein [Candidatus Saccharibacteria bacterium]